MVLVDSFGDGLKALNKIASLLNECWEEQQNVGNEDCYGSHYVKEQIPLPFAF